jgi:hypothetical protein
MINKPKQRKFLLLLSEIRYLPKLENFEDLHNFQKKKSCVDENNNKQNAR